MAALSFVLLPVEPVLWAYVLHIADVLLFVRRFVRLGASCSPVALLVTDALCCIDGRWPADCDYSLRSSKLLLRSLSPPIQYHLARPCVWVHQAEEDGKTWERCLRWLAKCGRYRSDKQVTNNGACAGPACTCVGVFNLLLSGWSCQ